MKKSLKLAVAGLVAALALMLLNYGPAFARALGTWEYPLLIVNGPTTQNGTLTVNGATVLVGTATLTSVNGLAVTTSTLSSNPLCLAGAFAGAPPASGYPAGCIALNLSTMRLQLSTAVTSGTTYWTAY